MSNFKSQAKRKRELAKLDKRQAKEQKRALRKAERSGTEVGAQAPAIAAVAQPMPANHRPAANAAPSRKPLTLAEAVERWRNTKVAKPKKR
ncbi:MAG TPA: hypothetical protein VIQ99_10675 [Gammaproteobacteria bacterium]